MPIDLNSTMAAFDRGIELLPRVIIAPLLLAGPTLLWLLYRFLVRPGSFRPSRDAADLTVWVCDSCSSLTPVDQSACYRCHAERPDSVFELEPDDVVAIVPIVQAPPPTRNAGVGVPVGPGRPAPSRPAPAPPAPFVLPAPPISRDGPVISPPSRIRVSGKATTASKATTATGRRRSKRA